jgi:hypothetical protein
MRPLREAARFSLLRERPVKPLVYIAGPYAHPDPVVNTRRACEVGKQLFDEGSVTPLVPHTTLIWHMAFPADVGYWYAYDLELLAHCDALLRLEGESWGADQEVAFAAGHGIAVFFSPAEVSAWAAGSQ